MSYEIVYDKQFIKLGDNLFVPMFLCGSNNCYDVLTDRRGNSYQRRERNWQEIAFHNTVGEGNSLIKYASLETFIASIDAYRLQKIERNEQNKKEFGDNWGEYNDKNFGYHASISIGGASTSRTSFGTYKNLWVLGCKDALTVEELSEIGIRVDVGVIEYLYKDELIAGKKEARKYYPTTSAELKEKCDELAAYYAGTNVRFWIHLSVNETRLKHYRLNKRIAEKNSKPQKPKKEYKEGYVFHGSNGYFAGGTKRGYKYTYYSDAGSAVRRYTEKQADSMVKKLNEKYGYSTKWKWEKITLRNPVMI